MREREGLKWRKEIKRGVSVNNEREKQKEKKRSEVQ